MDKEGVDMPGIFNRAEERQGLGLMFFETIKERPLLSVSFGLYWMWTVLLLYSPYLLRDGFGIVPLPSGVLIILVSVVTYFVAAFRFRIWHVFDGHAAFPYLLAVVLTLGALGFVSSGLDVLSADFRIFLGVSGSILVGIATAFVCLDTGRVFGWLGPLKVLFHGSVSLLGGSLAALVLSLAPWELACAVLVVVPIPMVFCLFKSLKDLPRAHVMLYGNDVEPHLPTRFLVTSAIQGMALGVMHSIIVQTGSAFSFLSTTGFCAAALLLIVTGIIVKQDFNTLFYRVGFPMMAVGFFVVGAWDGRLAAGSVFLDAGYAFQYLLSCCLCAHLARSLGQSPIWIIGLSTGCLLTGQVVGTIFDFAVLDSSHTALTMSFMIMASALYLFSYRNMRLGWGAVKPGEGSDVYDVRGETCRIIAGEKGLSKRETEIMLLISQGKTRKDIAESLHVSEETVKTHTGNVYRKLLIHSKAQLISCVDERMELISRQ